MKNDNFLIKGIIKENIEKDKVKCYENKMFYIAGSITYSVSLNFFEIPNKRFLFKPDDQITLGIEILLKDKVLEIRNNVLVT